MVLLRELGDPSKDTLSSTPEQVSIVERIDKLYRRPEVAKKQVGELTTAIVEEFGRGEDGREVLIIIGRAIEAANRFRWQPLPVPRVPRKMHRQSNPFEHGDGVTAIRTMRALQKVQGSWIEQCRSGAVPLELVLLSAMVEGSLLHSTMIEALLQRLNQTICPLEWWGDTPSSGRARKSDEVSRPFIDLSLDWRETQDSELRRWFVDPLTASLIVRMFQSKTAQQNESTSQLSLSKVWQNMRAAFRDYGMPQNLQPKTLQALFSSIRLARFSDNYPELLLSYCKRRVISHSLRRELLPRLHGERLIPLLPSTAEDRRFAKSNPMPAILSERSDEIADSRWYGDLLKAMRGDHREQVINNLESIVLPPATYPASARHIIEFAAFKVANGSAAGNSLALSTVRSYTSMVARYLGGNLEGRDPLDLPLSDLVLLYRETLDDCDQGRRARSMRRQLGRALAEWHHYLVVRHGVEGVNRAAVFGIGRDLVPVDANLLTPDEYFRVREIVRRRAPSKEIAQIALALLSLGFWLGLRRTEARGLRTIDLCELGVPMVVVRPWYGRRLKTKASARVLPLALLPEDELFALLAWKAKRAMDDDSGDEQFLFGLPKLDQHVVALAVFTVVQQAMWEATGDYTLRYHHLRHSCASWAFLRLCLSDFREPAMLFPKATVTTGLLSESARFRAAIYSAFPLASQEAPYVPGSNDVYALDGPIRQHAFSVAALLGHADASTTLEHYIHVLDLVVPLYQSASEFFPLSREAAIVASGFSRATGYRYQLEDLPAEIWRKLPDTIRNGAPNAQTAIAGSAPSQGARRWVERVWRMLYSADTERLPPEELAAEYGFDPATVIALVERARILRDIPHPLRPGERLHTMQSWTPDRRQSKQKVRLLCPYRPVACADRDVIARIEALLPEVVSANEDLSERVLKHFVQHQDGTGALMFDDPGRPENAQDYLAFLEALQIQRRNIEKKGSQEVSKRSEIQFLRYDPEGPSPSSSHWRQQLPFTSRDEIVRMRYRGSVQRLGILVHFDSAPGRPVVGNPGFRFVMLMAAIALPWLSQQELNSGASFRNCWQSQPIERIWP